MANRIYLTDKDTVMQDENNLVTVILQDGSKKSALEPRRLFPVSSPEQYITILDKDGVEQYVIRSLKDLNTGSIEAIVNSLEDYYLVPTIFKILKKEEKYGILRWTVETERGIRCFDIANRNHDIRQLPDGRIRVRDSNDNRYIIPSLAGLDAHSRNLLIADM